MSTTRYYYWLCLAGSILFEVAGTSVMKLSQSPSSVVGPAAGMAVMYLLLALSYICLAKAVVKLPLGVAYAFWEGFGLLLITLVSALVLQERFDGTRLVALGLVFGGVLLVHHGTGSSPEPVAPVAKGGA
ncbi:MAG: QacE family quaternary ammonium compound efflux SMR transporter [Deltaproteobacteria bacterium]|nr:QacE family quaternary ammonium compound efflux SMR transporter [Deltaproteobacteria bacterium]